MVILVTGGAGFIGSHTCLELLRRGYRVVVADDYSNSSPTALAAVREVSGLDLTAYEMDVRDQTALDQVFTEHHVDAVIHFAARKSVRESVDVPLDYYGANVPCTISLIKTMLEHDVHRLVFSSSCSIYGDRYSRPIAEGDEPGPTNPYARSKLICEQILDDACRAHPRLSVIALRYFNPIGAHPSGLVGEDPQGVPGNVLPFMMQVAVGRRARLDIYGDDYDTLDGTGVRDYIHVMDVAEAHCVALDRTRTDTGKHAFNLGTGCGVSVLQLLTMFEAISGTSIPYQIVGRKRGDVATLIADPSRVEKLWGWRTARDLPAMCRDAWRFQSLHPGGYPLSAGAGGIPPQANTVIPDLGNVGDKMRLSVIGTGHLGAVHAACMAELGHDVLGVDNDAQKIAALASGQAPFYEPGLAELLVKTVRSGRLRFSTSLAEAAEFADVHFVCVGTPQLAGSLKADLSHIETVIDGLASNLTHDCLLVGKSTVPVGTALRLAARLAALTGGTHATLAWNPEFAREGFAVQDTLRPDRLIVGVTSAEADAALRAVYAPLLAAGAPYISTNLATAELAKVAANAFLATKVSFINAVSDVCEATGADVVTLGDALGHDSRIGRRFLSAGLGYGGGCLPKDIRAFVARATELGLADSVRFLREVDEFNSSRRRMAVRLARNLVGGCLANQKVAVLGATFKPGTDDVRDSPALSVAEAVRSEGAMVRVHDPLATENARQVFPELDYATEPEKACDDADVVLHLTEWSQYRELDPAELRSVVRVPRLLDGRNVLPLGRWRAAGWTVQSMGAPPGAVGADA